MPDNENREVISNYRDQTRLIYKVDSSSNLMNSETMFGVDDNSATRIFIFTIRYPLVQLLDDMFKALRIILIDEGMIDLP